MRFYGLALLTSAAVLGACGGGEGAKKTDSTAATPAAGAAPEAAAPAAGAAVAKVAATGANHDIKMIGDDKGYRFEPADVTIKAGDQVTFINVSGGPHDIAFDQATTPEAGRAQLNANMDGKLGEMQGPMLQNPDEKYVVSFGGVAPGAYPYTCIPHAAMNMKGVITVQ